MTASLATPRQFVLVLGLLSGLAALTVDMCVPAIPTMVRHFDIDLSTGQQVVGAFMLGLALGQIPAGLISDRVGRMPVIHVGLTMFTIAGVVSAFSSTIETMLVARFVQGLGAAVGVVASRAVARDVASGAEAARLMSAIMMVFTFVPMLAPIAGSYVVTLWGWRGPFLCVAVTGALLLAGTWLHLAETRRPNREHHVLRQFALSFRAFFRHGQCIFGMLLMFFAAAGFMSMIAASSSLAIDLYGYPVRWFGYIYALAGLSLLCGSTLNRHLLQRFDALTMAGVAAALIALAALQLLLIAWLGQVSFWWLWACNCLYLVGVGFLTPSATAIVLEPLPETAGVASSIVGTLQGLAASAGAIVSGLLYDDSSRNVALLMGTFGLAAACVYLFRGLVFRTASVDARASVTGSDSRQL